MGIFGWFKQHPPASNRAGGIDQKAPSQQPTAGTFCTVRVCTILEESGFRWTWKLETPRRIAPTQQRELDQLVRNFCLGRYGSRPKTHSGALMRQSEVVVPFVIRG